MACNLCFLVRHELCKRLHIHFLGSLCLMSCIVNSRCACALGVEGRISVFIDARSYSGSRMNSFLFLCHKLSEFRHLLSHLNARVNNGRYTLLGSSSFHIVGCAIYCFSGCGICSFICLLNKLLDRLYNTFGSCGRGMHSNFLSFCNKVLKRANIIHICVRDNIGMVSNCIGWSGSRSCILEFFYNFATIFCIGGIVVDGYALMRASGALCCGRLNSKCIRFFIFRVNDFTHFFHSRLFGLVSLIECYKIVRFINARVDPLFFRHRCNRIQSSSSAISLISLVELHQLISLINTGIYFYIIPLG